ncbi:MAG: ATP synthase F0 subunit B [Bdellovibrionaceae bacterium]|nr:ATP synthase F0 subunit B [Pseudobdellovibrionaceae bacterium]
MKLLLCLAGIFLSQAAFAAEGHGDGIPGKLIFWQIFNLTILFSALTYFLRQPIKDYFAQRRTTFLSAAEKSQAARQEAEAKFRELKEKIENLDRTRTESLARAEAEAADLKKQMILSANEIATRIRKEAETTSQVEIMRARRELHEQFAQDAVTAARTALSSDISAQDQAKLQGDFVKNIEGVRP